MLELYWAYVDYTAIMELTEDLTRHLAREVFKAEQVTYGDIRDRLRAGLRQADV